MNLRIDVAFLARPVSSQETVVVIDVLRFTTITAVALHSGVREIFPFRTAEECLATQRPGDILAGEKQGVILPGFDVGTSPATFYEQRFPGKSVRATGSDGAPTCYIAADAKKVYLGAFVNLTALANRLTENPPEQLTLLCAGHKGEECVEDIAYAGALIERLQNFQLTPKAKEARAFWEQKKSDLRKLLFESSWGRRLVEVGRFKDVEVATFLDSVSAVPVLKKNPMRIVLDE